MPRDAYFFSWGTSGITFQFNYYMSHSWMYFNAPADKQHFNLNSTRQESTLSEQVHGDMEERWRTLTGFIMGVQLSRNDAQSKSPNEVALICEVSGSGTLCDRMPHSCSSAVQFDLEFVFAKRLTGRHGREKLDPDFNK